MIQIRPVSDLRNNFTDLEKEVIGQSAGYINNIENGVNLPSMAVFFYICEYLGITPKEFFDTDNANPEKAAELYKVAKRLKFEQLEHLIAIAKGLQ